MAEREQQNLLEHGFPKQKKTYHSYDVRNKASGM